jgi:DNA mismatch repair protein MutS2
MPSLYQTEIYLRRLSVEKALFQLERDVDATFVSGHKIARIIHGKGNGILRDVVCKRLAEHPLVLNYRSGFLDEGGAGVTIVEFVER